MFFFFVFFVVVVVLFCLLFFFFVLLLLTHEACVEELRTLKNTHATTITQKFQNRLKNILQENDPSYKGSRDRANVLTFDELLQIFLFLNKSHLRIEIGLRKSFL